MKKFDDAKARVAMALSARWRPQFVRDTSSQPPVGTVVMSRKDDHPLPNWKAEAKSKEVRTVVRIQMSTVLIRPACLHPVRNGSSPVFLFLENIMVVV
jgi:hypothetical protein